MSDCCGHAMSGHLGMLRTCVVTGRACALGPVEHTGTTIPDAAEIERIAKLAYEATGSHWSRTGSREREASVDRFDEIAAGLGIVGSNDHYGHGRGHSGCENRPPQITATVPHCQGCRTLQAIATALRKVALTVAAETREACAEAADAEAERCERLESGVTVGGEVVLSAPRVARIIARGIRAAKGGG